MSQDDDFWDDGEFKAEWPFWFVGTKQDIEGLAEVADGLSRVLAEPGNESIPVVFTDYEAAAQYAEDNRDEGDIHPFGYAEISHFVAFMEVLRGRGVEALAFDVYGRKFRHITIAEIVAAIEDHLPPQ